MTPVDSPSDPDQSLQAVLFDMDGTLVETEELWGEAMDELATALGGVFSAEGRQRTVGQSMRVAMQVLYDDLGLVRDDEQLRVDSRWVEERTATLMTSRGMPWRPGARELLVAVRAAGLATALVTTTPRRIAALVIDQIAADLGESPFDLTVCGDEVPARKPDPAPYLQAMVQLGVEPARCLVIEDSLVGVTAGLSSGAAVLGVPSVQPLERLPGLVLRPSLVDITVADLHQLLAERDFAPTT
ncbi:HAD family hydrolase [Modestobacter marinus]|nr:HAD family phosphatase [Modestobacter marinus]GGL77798.1 phosphoglycolate phosphatase [Modestobacter marinus]